MNRTTLNIGLARNIPGKPSIDSHEMLDILTFGTDVEVVSWDRHMSDSELTLVVSVNSKSLPTDRKLNALCELLDQDCLALYDEGLKEGRLVGPKASEWGPFDPARFVTLEGARLAT